MDTRPKIAPVPQSRPKRPGDNNTPVARLPELGLPANIVNRAEEIAQSQIERTELPKVKPGTTQIERTQLPKPKPGQTQIERTKLPQGELGQSQIERTILPQLTTPTKSSGLNLKEVLASDSLNLATPQSDGKSAKANRAEQLAEQRTPARPGATQIERSALPSSKVGQTQIERAVLPTPKPGQSQIERGTTPVAKPAGVVKVAGGLAGQAALPAGVRPLIPSTEITRLPELLPSGSNDKGTGLGRPITTAEAGTARANIESAKAEQLKTRQNLAGIKPVADLTLTTPKKPATATPAAGGKEPLAPLPVTMITTPSTKPAIPSKSAAAPNATSLNDQVTDMIRSWGGITGKTAKQTAPQFMGTVTLDGIRNYTPEQKSQGYGSKGYSETYAAGGQRYDPTTGNWVGETKGTVGGKVK